MATISETLNPIQKLLLDIFGRKAIEAGDGFHWLSEGYLKKVLSLLTYREREVLKFLYGLDSLRVHSHVETAKHFNTTAREISQSKKSALKKLRLPSRAQHLTWAAGVPDISFEEVPVPADLVDVLTDTLAAMSVNDLELCVRARKALQRLNIKTVRDLVKRSEEELLVCKNFGSTSLQEIVAQLKFRGLHLNTFE